MRRWISSRELFARTAPLSMWIRRLILNRDGKSIIRLGSSSISWINERLWYSESRHETNAGSVSSRQPPLRRCTKVRDARRYGIRALITNTDVCLRLASQRTMTDWANKFDQSHNLSSPDCPPQWIGFLNHLFL